MSNTVSYQYPKELFDEFVKRVKKDGDFAKMWINN